MEEEQIQEFMHLVTENEQIRRELLCDPARVIALQGFSPRVAWILARVVPQLAFEQPEQLGDQWWHV